MRETDGVKRRLDPIHGEDTKLSGEQKAESFVNSEVKKIIII